MNQIIQKILHGYTVLETVDSKINGSLEIREDLLSRRTLVAGGLAQSGKEVEVIWKKVIQQYKNLVFDKNLDSHDVRINNCLILGLGAGSVAQLISKKYPEIKMTGIEIDPEIIKLGKKYFKLDKISGLETKVADAVSFVSNGTMKQSSNFDLILIDLYLGNQYPKQAESTEFLQSLKNLLSKDGLIVINRLYYHELDKQQTGEFGKKLRNAFNQVDEKEINWNKFFFVR